MLKALVDGDFLTYSCGFSSDSVAKKDAIERGEDLTGEEHEPLAYCLHGVKKTMQNNGRMIL